MHRWKVQCVDRQTAIEHEKIVHAESSDDATSLCQEEGWLVGHIELISNELSGPCGLTRSRQLGQWLRRHALSTTIAVLLLLVTGGWAGWYLYDQAQSTKCREASAEPRPLRSHIGAAEHAKPQSR